MKKLLLPQVNIYTPSIRDGKVIEKSNDDIDIDNFLHYPLLINDDGSLWKYGNLYLLSKLKAYTKVSSKTLDSIAADLKNFKEWCDVEDIDYLNTVNKFTISVFEFRKHPFLKFL